MLILKHSQIKSACDVMPEIRHYNQVLTFLPVWLFTVTFSFTAIFAVFIFRLFRHSVFIFRFFTSPVFSFIFFTFIVPPALLFNIFVSEGIVCPLIVCPKLQTIFFFATINLLFVLFPILISFFSFFIPRTFFAVIFLFPF